MARIFCSEAMNLLNGTVLAVWFSRNSVGLMLELCPYTWGHNRMEVYMSLMHLLHFVTKQPTVRTMAIAGKHTILGFPHLTFFKEKPLQFHAITKFIYINRRIKYRKLLQTHTPKIILVSN